MNYYGVLGLLARLEQLRLNQDQAYIYAKRVIDEVEETKAITLIDKADIESTVDSWKDLNYSCEMLFSLYTNNLYEMTNVTFYMDGESGDSRTSFGITTNLYTTFLNEIYGRTPDGAGTDNRLRYWFKLREGGGYYEILKLKKAPEAQGLSAAYDPEVPIMRLPEIYYIACEAQIGKDNDLALSYLNAVRETRNLVKLEGSLSAEELREYLIRDERKEFIGEGCMFLFYKRLFASIYVKQGVVIAPLDANFIFPIPDAEYEYSPNEK